MGYWIYWLVLEVPKFSISFQNKVSIGLMCVAFGAETSDQPQLLEARVPVLADDDVVVHLDAERFGDVDDHACHLDVGTRGGGVAAGVIVHQPILVLYHIDITTF
jgi:hypothetical protein